MCGIFAYKGERRNATLAVYEGLKRLDYRGYDSWGISTIAGKRIKTQKFTGCVDRKKLVFPKSKYAIGHTRWATNGGVTKTNAHPHVSGDRSFCLVHNGIVENFSELKQLLSKRGLLFTTQTDTEVILKFIEYQFTKTRNFDKSLRVAFKKLAGRNTIVVLRKDGQIYALRNGSPLVIGIDNSCKEYYFSSDTLSFSTFAEKYLMLDNNQMAHLNNGVLRIEDIKKGSFINYAFKKNNINQKVISKNTNRHFMIKEINEEPEVIHKVIKGNKTKILKLAEKIKNADKVYCLGSGTAAAAALQMAYYLRIHAGIEALGLIGAESKDYLNLLNKNDLIIALSQSGETADVIEILEQVKRRGVTIATYVNMPGSMMTKISEIKFLANAGPEICVMSTKVFVSQIAWGFLISKSVKGQYNDAINKLEKLCLTVQKLLRDKTFDKNLNRIAKKINKLNDVFLIGKGQNLQIIREGMIKIIEGTYIHAHAIPAGDLKHYAITLMQKGVRVICLLSEDADYSDTMNAVGQLKARGASIIGVSRKNNQFFEDHIKVPQIEELDAIINIIPLQLLAYKIALLRGNNVDKPRNIAKSVTVK